MKIITQACFPQRFTPPLGSIFQSLIFELNQKNPDGTSMLNTVLEEFPSHILKLAKKEKKKEENPVEAVQNGSNLNAL